MTAAPATPALAAETSAGWIQSPGWDLFWMFSGLWMAALLLTASLAPGLLALVMGLFVVDRLLSVLHSWSTTYMVLWSPLLAEERSAHPLKYRWVPALLFGLSLALGLVVAATQRYPADGRFTWDLWPWGVYLLLFWVGHFWHFGNQDFGVLTLYRARAGQDRPIDRRVDKLYTALMMFVIQPAVYVGVIGSTAFSELVRSTLPFAPVVLLTAATASVGIAVLLTAATLAWELSRERRSLPKILYVMVIFLHPVLLYTAWRAQSTAVGLLYIVAYLWSHWLIAIGLVGRINTRYLQSRGERPWRALGRHAVALAAIAGVVFLLTERHGEYLLFNTSEFGYKELLAAITPEQVWVIGGVLGFFLGEQLVHYYCDRCLFRFRNPGVRRRVAPLLLGGAPASRAPGAG